MSFLILEAANNTFIRNSKPVSVEQDQRLPVKTAANPFNIREEIHYEKKLFYRFLDLFHLFCHCLFNQYS